jgi:hypothetical protein
MPHTHDLAIMECSGLIFGGSWIAPDILSNSILTASAMGVIYLVPIFVAVGDSQFAWIWAVSQWDGNRYNMVHLLHPWSIMADSGARWGGFI